MLRAETVLELESSIKFETIFMKPYLCWWRTTNNKQEDIKSAIKVRGIIVYWQQREENNSPC